jgi:chromosome segregation ATPase
MADDQLDDLYAAKPEDFTALRTELATAAKKRGEADAAKRISAARKPTTAAWIVNLLALRNADAKRRLADLGDQLREAHAAMDGERIRGLSSGQRRLVDELARAAFEEADVADPSAALRDDVTGTLQAAIADPDVAARLGRLTKAERWSGFGELGDTAVVFTATRGGKAKKEIAQQKPGDDKDDAARRQREEARAAVAAAERAKADADAAMAGLQADLATARLRRVDARSRLEDAERGLAAAEDAYDRAKQAGRDAAAAVKEAKAKLKSAASSRTTPSSVHSDRRNGRIRPESRSHRTPDHGPA